MGDNKVDDLNITEADLEKQSSAEPDPEAHATKPDLWNLAWANVIAGEYGKYVPRYERIISRENMREVVGQANYTKPLGASDRAYKMHTALENHATRLQESRWELVVAGRKVGVGKSVDDIISGVLYAKDFITRTLATVGEPHAALAWAGISLLLPVRSSYVVETTGNKLFTDQGPDVAHCELHDPTSSRNTPAAKDCRPGRPLPSARRGVSESHRQAKGNKGAGRIEGAL